MGFGFVLLLLVVGLVMYLFGWRPRWFNHHTTHDQNKSPMDIIKERYARGEITREQYDELRRDLSH